MNCLISVSRSYLPRRFFYNMKLIPNPTATSVSSTVRMFSLQGKTALVTASTEGIGYAIAERLSKDGAKVVVSSRKQNNVDKAVASLKNSGCNVSGIVCHVGKKEDRQKLIQHAIDTYGRIDILISNAGTNPVTAQVLDTPEDVWDKIFDTNVKSAFLLTQEVVPHMQKNGSGCIIYIASIAGFRPIEVLGAYSVSKTALLGLTKAVANQLASDNIRVNSVCPGIVKTKFSKMLWNSEESLELLKGFIPLQRPAASTEISGMVSFLCSDDASYITGENFPVAGGMISRL